MTGAELTIADLRRIQLEIMDCIHDFCSKHDLRYFLMYGSLIGAIRHNGYIPWDDDIDIIMPRPDYEIFIAEFSSDFYSVYSSRSQNKWPLLYSKVCDRRTKLIEDSGLENGVFVDVFPLDGMSSSKNTASVHLKQSMRLKLILRMHRFAPRMSVRGLSMHDIALFILSWAIHYLLSYEKVLARFNKMSIRYLYDSSDFCGDLCAGSMNRVFDRSLFDSSLDWSFEGHLFKIPVGYDECLKTIYGDYMKLPPIEQRCSNHDFKAFWKGDE